MVQLGAVLAAGEQAPTCGNGGRVLGATLSDISVAGNCRVHLGLPLHRRGARCCSLWTITTTRLPPFLLVKPARGNRYAGRWCSSKHRTSVFFTQIRRVLSIPYITLTCRNFVNVTPLPRRAGLSFRGLPSRRLRKSPQVWVHTNVIAATFLSRLARVPVAKRNEDIMAREQERNVKRTVERTVMETVS